MVFDGYWVSRGYGTTVNIGHCLQGGITQRPQRFSKRWSPLPKAAPAALHKRTTCALSCFATAERGTEDNDAGRPLSGDKYRDIAEERVQER